MINRTLVGEKKRPSTVLENGKGQVVQVTESYLVFDDTVVGKNFLSKMEMVRCHGSGITHGVIKGIGGASCVYINPELDMFWIIDDRIYDPTGDGKTKLDHVQEMLANTVYAKKLLFGYVLVDSWYATRRVMVFIEALKKVY